MYAMCDNLADRLRFLQGAASNRAWAKTLGVSEGAVRNYQAGRVPPADFVRVVCERTGADPWWLLTGEGDWRRDAPRSVLVQLAAVDPEEAAASAALHRVWQHGTDAQRAAVQAVLAVVDPGEKKERPDERDANEGVAGGAA